LNIIDFFICALAASAVVDIWFNGSIFADQRQLIDARDAWCCLHKDPQEDTAPRSFDADTGVIDTWVNKCPCLLAQLLNCAHCLSFHTPLWIMGWYFGVTIFHPVLTFILRLPVFSLAAGRLMNIIVTLVKQPYQQEP
jgi:hypothetical protein